MVALWTAAAALSAVALGDEPPGPPTVRFATTTIEQRATPALDAISYPWETELPGWHIDFVGANGDIAGYTWSRDRRIEIFVRDDATSADIARILAHEFGHAVDIDRNDPSERARWLEVRGAPDAPWWPIDGAADFATGAGDFAESFTVWQVGADDYRSELAPVPTGAQLDLLIEMATTG